MLRPYYYIGVDFIEHGQNQAGFGDVGHRTAVMLVANLSVFIDQQQGRDTSQFEQVPFLSVQVGDFVFGVGQANVGQFVLVPVALVGFGAIGTDAQDFRVTRGEGCIVISQVFEMGAAVGSHESAQEDQDYMLFAFVIR